MARSRSIEVPSTDLVSPTRCPPTGARAAQQPSGQIYRYRTVPISLPSILVIVQPRCFHRCLRSLPTEGAWAAAGWPSLLAAAELSMGFALAGRFDQHRRLPRDGAS